MHYHLEVIMPPTDDVEGAIKKILAPFDEDAEDARHALWDWYQIGGRFAGSKAEARFPKEKMDAFHAWMKQEKITVSGLQWGKQELSPASQIEKVDAKWREMFGVTGPCSLFLHSNKNHGALPGDICELKYAMYCSAHRVIIAGPSYDGSIEATYMVAQSEWNGVSHIETKWDGTIRSALEAFTERAKSYKDEWREKIMPHDDWISVTVDYHN